MHGALASLEQVLVLFVAFAVVPHPVFAQDATDVAFKDRARAVYSLPENTTRNAAIEQLWEEASASRDVLLPALTLIAEDEQEVPGLRLDTAEFLEREAASDTQADAARVRLAGVLATIDPEMVGERRWLETALRLAVSDVDTRAALERWRLQGVQDTSGLLPGTLASFGRYWLFLMGSLHEEFAAPLLADLARTDNMKFRITALEMLSFCATPEADALRDHALADPLSGSSSAVDTAHDSRPPDPQQLTSQSQDDIVRARLAYVDLVARGPALGGAPSLTASDVRAALKAGRAGDWSVLGQLRHDGWEFEAAAVLDPEDEALLRRSRRERLLSLSDEAAKDYLSLSFVLLRLRAGATMSADAPVAGPIRTLRVVDEQGRTVAGAHAVRATDRWVSGRSTDAGILFVEDVENHPVAIVAKPGFVPRVVSLNGAFDPGEPMEVELDRTTLLEIVPSPMGAPFSAWSVEALIERSDGMPLELLDRTPSSNEFLPLVGGASRTMWGFSAAGRLAEAYAITADGSAAITGMPSGVPLKITLRDGSGIALGEPIHITLGPNEARVVTAPIAMSDRHAGGTVRDMDGRAVAGADVTVLAETTPVAQAVSGPDGRFDCRWRAPTASVADLVVRADEHVAALVLLPPGPLSDLSVSLGSGRAAGLVVHSAGLSTLELSGTTVQLRGLDVTSGVRVDGEPGSGLFELEGLPEADVELTVEFAGRRFTSILRADKSQGFIHLPRVGSLEVRWSGLHESECIVEILALDDEGGFQSLPAGTGEGVVFPAVLPGRYGVEMTSCDHAPRSSPVVAAVRHGHAQQVDLTR